MPHLGKLRYLNINHKMGGGIWEKVSYDVASHSSRYLRVGYSFWTPNGILKENLGPQNCSSTTNWTFKNFHPLQIGPFSPFE